MSSREEFKERDTLFCELLFELGSIKDACAQMDISVRLGRKIAERRKNEILEMTNTELSALAYQAVSTFRASLTEDGTIPKAEIRLKAAEDILDRIGASKKTTTEVSVVADRPVILMPAKDKETVPTISIEAE